ncbi:RING-H2 finger protein ATL16-like [Nicotiana tabacum]|uniref:RING-type E3 ubiquitin transferase n=1 Tax=Nicotiana tabacum TaxID=4097 RepID=A0A1S3ZQ41_TOBAC|nr:RING-H2 finger protein ATL16-like [Nicotiana tomentosiformis]XP_016466477.1 PREDICTED: RING-H2 finger protein ATL16-like [Nicotiana tabacum]
MDAAPRHLFSFKNQQNNISITQPPMGAVSSSGFPIIGVAMLGIMAIGFLLVSYYIFVSKCCINWQQFDPLRRFFSTRPRQYEDPLMGYSPSRESRGLDELVIRDIPTFQYSRNRVGERSFRRCVVCLNEFKEDEMLRLLPKCSHAFHLDCIDIWLQNNASCPLCRTSISGATNKHPLDMIVAPNSSPQDPHIPLLRRSSILGSEEDFVVIELSGELEAQNRSNSISRELLQSQSRSHSSRKFEQRIGKLTKQQTRKFSIMGDECINVREKDAQFSVEPIRRSFSMDSAADRHVYLSVQEMIRHNRHLREVRNNGESSSRSIRKSIFSFGHRRSKTSVLPFEF